MSLVSFIIVNRNTSELLLNCIKHILDSDLPRPFEVIVVDNGSTDSSVLDVNQHFPAVKVKEAGRNLGFAAANNKALIDAKGDYIFLVNTDVMLKPDCASILLDFLEQHPEVGLVSPQLLNADDTKQTSFEAVPDIFSEILNRSLLKRLFPKKYPGKHSVYNVPTEVDAVIGAVMVLRKHALVKVGGFDERYFFFLEETDLAVSLRKNGFKVVHNPLAQAYHLQGGTANKYKVDSRIEFYRSRYRFFAKHYGTSREMMLRLFITANLVLSSVGLGLANLVTLQKSESLRDQYRVKKDLLKWHFSGCKDGPGLPRN